MFDIVIGSGTGFITASSFGFRHQSIQSQPFDFYSKLSQEVFCRASIQKLVAHGKHSSLYDEEALQRLLLQRFGQGLTLSSVSPKLLGVTKRNHDGGIFLLRNYEAKDTMLSPGESGWNVVEAIRACIASPLHLPPFEKGSNVYRCAPAKFNNPTKLLIDELQELSGRRLSDFVDVVVTLGTGGSQYEVLEDANLMEGDILSRIMAPSIMEESREVEVVHRLVKQLQEQERRDEESPFEYYYFNPPLSIFHRIAADITTLENIRKIAEPASDGAEFRSLCRKLMK